MTAVRFLVANTFTDSLSKLTLPEQKQAKSTAFGLQMDLSGNSHQFHGLDNAKNTFFGRYGYCRPWRPPALGHRH
jgi:hypothetical protein